MTISNLTVQKRLTLLLFGVGQICREKLNADIDFEIELQLFRNLAFVYGHPDEELHEFIDTINSRQYGDIAGMERTVDLMITNLLDD